MNGDFNLNYLACARHRLSEVYNIKKYNYCKYLMKDKINKIRQELAGPKRKQHTNYMLDLENETYLLVLKAVFDFNRIVPYFIVS